MRKDKVTGRPWDEVASEMLDMMGAVEDLPALPAIEVGPCNMTEAEIQDVIHMVERGTDPQTAVMLAKQHP